MPAQGHIFERDRPATAAVVAHLLKWLQRRCIVKLSDYFDARYYPERLLQRSPRTTQEYKFSVQRLTRHLGRPATLEDLTTETLYAFRTEETEDHSPETVNKHLRQLLAIARHAAKWQQIPEAPEVEKLKCPKRAPVAWTPAEMQSILQAAKRKPGRIRTISADKWWPALILSLYDTGARISAMMAARWEWLDGVVLTIPAEVQKQNADQRYRLRPQTIAAIEAIRPWEATAEFIETPNGLKQKLRRKTEGLLFDWCYDPDRRWKVLTRHYRQILKWAGLPHTQKDCFHKIRRTTATRIADARGKAAAQSYLGHSSAKVTESYIDYTQVRAADISEHLPDI